MALLGWLTSVGWFITDDAFISFRYVRNLLEGHGLVFNPGEYVEGYTNFLWILELAAIWRVLGIRPEHVANWLSVIYTVGTIAVMLWWVARMPFLRHRGTDCLDGAGVGLQQRNLRRLDRGRRPGDAPIHLLCPRRGGRPERVRRQSLGADRGLAKPGRRRFDAARRPAPGRLLRRLVRGPPRAHGDRMLDWRGTLALAGPFAVLIGGHFLTRYRYYGEWLPNTYYAKHVGPWYESGFRYLWAAAIETGLYLLIPLTYVALRGPLAGAPGWDLRPRAAAGRDAHGLFV